MSRFWLKWSVVFFGLAFVFFLAAALSFCNDEEKTGNAKSAQDQLIDRMDRLGRYGGKRGFRFEFSRKDRSDANQGLEGYIPVPCAGIEEIFLDSQSMKGAKISTRSAQIRVMESPDRKIHVKVIRNSRSCSDMEHYPYLQASLKSDGILKVDLSENDDYAQGEVRELVVSIPRSNTGYVLAVLSVSGDVEIVGIRAASLGTTTVSGDFDVKLVSALGDWFHASVSGDLMVKVASVPSAKIEMWSVSGDLNLSKKWSYSVASSGGLGKKTLVANPAGKVSGQWEFKTVSGDITLE